MSSISSIGGGGSAWGMQSMPPRRPPDLGEEQFADMKTRLESEGKDTSNIDKILENFDQIDTDGDGKISRAEMEAGAEEFGIELPKGPPPGGPPPGENGGPPFHGGPPPEMQIADSSELETQNNTIQSLLEKLLAAYNNNESGSTSASTIETAA